MNTTGIFSNSSSVITKYTQTGGSFKTYAARKVSGTATSHINMESMIIPNLESPPPLKQPHIRQVLMPSPTRRQVVIIRNLSYNKRAETGINAEIFYKIVYIIKQ